MTGPTASFIAGLAVRRKVDVVLVQELCRGQFRRLRTLLAPHGFRGRFAAQTHSHECGDDTAFGVAVLTRGPILRSVVRRLPTTPGVEGRVLLATTAVLDGRRMLVAAVHLSPSPRDGLAKQLSAVAGFADPRADGPAIIGGDFNSLPGTEGLDRMYSSSVGGSGRFIELDEDRSGNPEKGGRPTFAAKKIDYVFLSAAFFTRPRASTVVTPLSDHRAYVGSASLGVVEQ